MSDIFVFIATRTTADVALPAQASDQRIFNRQVSNAFQGFAGGHLIVGDLKLRPNSDAVSNYLLCDGSEVSRTAFPELFALLGESEGAGDGATTFNLPNYLGTAVEIPADAPAQTITDGGTVAVPVTQPTEPGETGGTDGGNILSGGRARQLRDLS